jgi:hypothetical protein
MDWVSVFVPGDSSVANQGTAMSKKPMQVNGTGGTANTGKNNKSKK